MNTLGGREMFDEEVQNFAKKSIQNLFSMLGFAIEKNTKLW